MGSSRGACTSIRQAKIPNQNWIADNTIQIRMKPKSRDSHGAGGKISGIVSVRKDEPRIAIANHAHMPRILRAERGSSM
ncbi:hypothetical protein D3C84_920370 [compost metagenome]